ncbi:MAG: hypothetical protein ACYDDA_13415 [Acidiferrobacteraceae bacterium]
MAFVESGVSFWYAVREFLDHFAGLPNDQERSRALRDAPLFLKERTSEGAVQDAYLAAVAEKLSWDRHLLAPEWVFKPERFLRDPWFAATDLPGLRPLLLLESPVMFRRRNLFVSANALDRARRSPSPGLSA